MDIILQRIIELIGKKHGATKELAEALGISPNNITNWKNGYNKGYPKYLPQIAGYYGVSVDWLAGLSDEKEYKKIPASEITDGDRENAIDVLQGLTSDEMDIVRAYAQGVKAARRRK
ncbi:helix-turn-helix transcriptional regulator [Oscillibacter sp.]|uniref:helix-turn-helix domain-containing protein n=1 Tax=Oscillibacter sp. TaxID=1945593 RepID=UPI002896C07D|nr:helix-turn-helix transcriptional regulator [Oscillibacter sp.]